MPDRPPNIVLMISHDLGCHIGPYGWAKEQSTNLSRLANGAVRFDNHFVTSPGCSPSRASLVTGRYPHSNGQFGLAHLGWTLHRNEILLPTALRAAGYHTALFGIWHLHEWTLSGFDTLSFDVSTRDSSPEGYAEVASGRASQWLRRNAYHVQPFYLHVGFWEVHRPFCSSDAQSSHAKQIAISRADIPLYLPDNPPTREEFAQLHQSVALVDQGVGSILDSLDDAGLRENTLVIFTADHGLPFPRAKGTLYDPGIQVALLVQWPGNKEARRVLTLTSNVDVMPTLLQAAQVEIPAAIQGHSFLDFVLHESPNREHRDAVFAEKSFHEHYDPMRAVRTERFKYIRNFADRPMLLMPSDVYNSPTQRTMTDDEALWSTRPREELYDLADDSDETVSRIGNQDYADTLAEMRGRLDRWMRETDDPIRWGPIPRCTADE